MLCSEEVATSGPLCRTLSTPASGWCAIYEGTSLDISARSCSALQGYRGAVAPSLPLLKQGLQLFQWYLQWPFVSSDIFRFFMFLKLFGDLAQGVQFIILGPTWEETKVIAFAPQELPCQEHLCGSGGLAAPGLLGSIWWWRGELVSVAIRKRGKQDPNLWTMRRKCYLKCFLGYLQDDTEEQVRINWEEVECTSLDHE